MSPGWSARFIDLSVHKNTCKEDRAVTFLFVCLLTVYVHA